MIYTTYFSNLKNLPKNIVPISICAKAPQSWRGLQYKKLAPKYGFFTAWKKMCRNVNKDKQNEANVYYIEHYHKDVLSKLTPQQVINELQYLCELHNEKDAHIALVCYEKSSDFCHRHLVAQWLNAGGYECREWTEEQ